MKSEEEKELESPGMAAKRARLAHAAKKAKEGSQKPKPVPFKPADATDPMAEIKNVLRKARNKGDTDTLSRFGKHVP